jgi:hypothetical protein
MPRYYNQLHQQLGHEMKPFRFRFPPLHRSPSLARHPQSIVCTVQHRTSLEVLPNILAVMPCAYSTVLVAIIITPANSSNSDRLMLHNLARPSRSRRNSGRIPLRARRLISVHRIPHPATVLSIIYDFTTHIPTPIIKRFASHPQHSHLQRETVVKFGERRGLFITSAMVYDTLLVPGTCRKLALYIAI